MTDKLPRIVFMGTPEFAVASLKALADAGYDIAAVVTAPDKPAGRGRIITASPVKNYALDHGMKLMQPERLRNPEFLNSLKEINADIFVVVAFRMLPEEVWSMPPLGTINLHASLLPQYRGAAPINHVIINGGTKTGVTTFLIDKKIDTGKILLARETEIGADENAGSLHDRLMEIGSVLVKETVEGLYNHTIKPVPQITGAGTDLKPAPKIFPPDTIIDWRKPAVNVYNLIRGLSPYPGAVATLHRENMTLRIKIFESRLIEGLKEIPGMVINDENKRFIISCTAGAIEILTLQPEGRKKMSAAEFLRGFNINGWEPV